MVRKTVYIEKSQYDALRRIARRKKTSVSALGREAIARVLRKYRNRIPLVVAKGME
jgi:hypothetical protein